MGIKTTTGYRVLSKIPAESLDLYIKSFTSGSGETILVGRSDTLDLTITRGTRTSDGEGNALQIQGGQATGTNEQGGDVNIYTGYPTGNGAAGDFKVFGALSKGSSGTSVNPSNSTMLSVSGDTGNVVINGSLTVGSTQVFNSSGVLQVATQGTIDHDSLANFVAAEHVDWAGASAGTIHSTNIPTLNQDTTGTATNATKQVVVTHHHFFMNSTSTTADFFFPYNNLNEASSTSQYYTRTIAPYDGRIIKVLIRPSAGIGTSCEVQFHKITDTSTDFGTLIERVHSLNLNTAETSVTATFSSATFSAGDVVNVSLIKSDSATANIQAVVVWEYTT